MQQDELLRFVAVVLDRLRIRYALVGSFASGIWGETRFTQHIGVVVELTPDQSGPLCEAFPGADFYVSRAAVDQAIENRRPFNVIHPASGNKIDFMVTGDAPWQRGQLDRARTVQLAPDVAIRVASPADVIVGKLAYYAEGGSDKHLRDIRGILDVMGESVDTAYVGRQAVSLGVDGTWQRLLRETL